MFKWKVEYLTGFGAMTINEEVEYYTAWTKRGVWKQFLKAHPKLPDSYTDISHFTKFRGFCRLVTRV